VNTVRTLCWVLVWSWLIAVAAASLALMWMEVRERWL
jgi:hypothetical protein